MGGRRRGGGLSRALRGGGGGEAGAGAAPFLATGAGEMGRPVAARHGFQTITTATACEWPATADSDAG